MSKPAYKRVLLKLSGEALMGDDPYGINRATIERMFNEPLILYVPAGIETTPLVQALIAL